MTSEPVGHEKPLPELDVSHVPRGVIAATALVTAVAAGDDRLERHYLEIKGPLDLGKKTDLAKIAKFILGAANRDPAIAATAFEGFAVMVIGVWNGRAEGVPPIEILEIERVVAPFLGASGPRWDLVRVAVADSPNEVLVILVDPPLKGHGPFLCRQNGEGMTDGRVYFRADGETREAKADELDQLIKRGSQAPPPDVSFEVIIVGRACQIELDDARTIDEYVESTRDSLAAAAAAPVHQVGRAGGFAQAFQSGLKTQSALDSLLGTVPEARTKEEYMEAIDRWEASVRAAWPSAVDVLAGKVLPGIVIRVHNPTKTFFRGIELKLHLAGAVRGIDFLEFDTQVSQSDLRLPPAPRHWGPRAKDFFSPQSFANMVPYTGTSVAYQSNLSWDNSGSIDLTLDVGDLRPRGTFQSDDDELVLVLPLGYVGGVEGTWEITAQGHNEIYSGELLVSEIAVCTLTDGMRKILF